MLTLKFGRGTLVSIHPLELGLPWINSRCSRISSEEILMLNRQNESGVGKRNSGP